MASRSWVAIPIISKGRRSLPVFNAVFGTKLAPPTNVAEHYNKWQTPFAIVVMIISGFAQFLKYKRTDYKAFLLRLVVIASLAFPIAGLIVYLTGVYTQLIFILMTYAAVFAILANGQIVLDAFKGKWKLAGSSVAHIGFALMLMGALIAASTNKVISVNRTGIGFGDDFAKSNNPKESIILYQDGPVKMDRYTVTYVGDSVVGPNTYYRVNYRVIDEKTGAVKENFDLYPNAQQNAKMRQIVASPDTRHYLFQDIYTHVSAVPPKEDPQDHEHHEDHEGHSDDENYEKPLIREVNIGDTVRFRDGLILVKGVKRDAEIKNIRLKVGDVAIAMQLEVHKKGKVYSAVPIYLLKNGTTVDFGKTVEEADLKLRFSNIYPDKNKLELMVYQKPKKSKDNWIVMKAILFPYINLFWVGGILMVVGFLISIFRRNSEIKVK